MAVGEIQKLEGHHQMKISDFPTLAPNENLLLLQEKKITWSFGSTPRCKLWNLDNEYEVKLFLLITAYPYLILVAC